jgi:hypothetical protein
MKAINNLTYYYMSNTFNWKDAVGAVLFMLLIAGGFINSAIAANLSSIVLNRGSIQGACITDENHTELDLLSSFSVAGWVKLDSQPAQDDAFHIFAKQNGNSPDRAYQMYYQDSGGVKMLGIALSADGDTQKNFDVNASLNLNEWYHVAFVFTAGTNIEIFLNGNSIGSDSLDVPSSLHNSANNACVGVLRQGESLPQLSWDGKIDDIRVWNRALSSSEIVNLYNNPENFSNGSNLAGWWKFDNDYTDSSGNGNTLTPINDPTFSSDVPFDAAPPPPPPATIALSAYKSANESVNNSAALQGDDHLWLSLAANKTYAVEGMIFISSTKTRPDAKISFNADPNSAVMLGYITPKEVGVLTDGSISPRIVLPANNPVPVFIKGTIKTGDDPTNFDLLWAQATSNTAPTSVLKGSYIKATEL